MSYDKPSGIKHKSAKIDAFDITYARFSPVTQHETRQDTLKMILAEVLRDFRENKQCYVKYERKQGCFHITVR